MKTFTGTLASFAIITAIAAPALAQDPQPSSPQPTQQAQPAPRYPVPLDQDKPQTEMATEAADESSATGELVKVDTDAMEIVIKSADDTQHTFRYADRGSGVRPRHQDGPARDGTLHQGRGRLEDRDQGVLRQEVGRQRAARST